MVIKCNHISTKNVMDNNKAITEARLETALARYTYEA